MCRVPKSVGEASVRMLIECSRVPKVFLEAVRMLVKIVRVM